MAEKPGLGARFARAKQRAREDGFVMILVLALREGLKRIGIKFNPFYYIEEMLPQQKPAALMTLPAGYEFSFFGPEEMRLICDNPERKAWPPRYVKTNYLMGDTCLGCKYKGEIAGFTWYSLKESREWFYQVKMKENEAYLYDIFVFKAYRGKKLSLLLRLKSYEILRDLGRDTLFSISDYTNKPSLMFKRQLNARKVFFGLHIEVFAKWQKTWILKRYPH